MARMTFGLGLLMTLLIAGEVSAGDRTLNLALPSGTNLTVAAEPGEVVTFTLVNRVPTGTPYTITIKEQDIPIPPFSKPGALPAGAMPAADACSDLVLQAESLGAAGDEQEVEDIVRSVRASLATQACKEPEALAKANEWLAQTVYPLPGSYTVRAGVEIVLAVVRGDRTWTLTVSGGERGRWLTTYGLSIVPSRDKPFFTKALTDDQAGQFAITKETEVDEVRLLPSVFLTWLPRSRANRDLSFGLTAGLGVSQDQAAVFGGVGLTYNWNLSFIGGLAVSPHARLRGRYSPGDVLGEALDHDQVNRQAFRPTWMMAVTFRFAGNPFTSDDGPAEAAAAALEATKKAAEEKKAEEDKAAAGQKPDES